MVNLDIDFFRPRKHKGGCFCGTKHNHTRMGAVRALSVIYSFDYHKLWISHSPSSNTFLLVESFRVKPNLITYQDLLAQMI